MLGQFANFQHAHGYCVLIQTVLQEFRFTSYLLRRIQRVVTIAFYMQQKIPISLRLTGHRHTEAPHLLEYFEQIHRKENLSTFLP